MIRLSSVASNFSWRSVVVIAVLMVPVVWLASRSDSQPVNRQTASAPLLSGPSLSTQQAVTIGDTVSASAMIFPPVPPDVDKDEWQSVVKQLNGNPHRDAEIKRMGEYLTFHNRAQQWAELQASPDSDPVERTRLAGLLLDEIPARVIRAEMTPMEAKSLAGRLLADTMPEGQGRESARIRAEENIDNVVKSSSTLTPEQLAQVEAYKYREAEVKARWESLPEGQRDQGALASQLAALAKEIFSGP